MCSTLRRSSLPFAATLLVQLLGGCAASKALEAPDSPASPSGAAVEDSHYAHAPAQGDLASNDDTPLGNPSAEREGFDRAEPSSAAELPPSPSKSRSGGTQPAAPRLGASHAEESAALGADAVDSARRAQAQRLRSTEARPGLGTTWGENRNSFVREVSFVRQSSTVPSALFRIQYNDETGILAQTGEPSLESFTSNYTVSPNRFVSVEIVDANGSPMQGLARGDRTYVLGHHGDRYAIRVTNHQQQRYEVVATVDGLDVMDGTRGGYGKSGYVLNGYDTLLIEGFRRSDSQVAAFRFGKVKDSYSVQSGKGDRNVGVVGVAVFEERHAVPVYTEREIQLRETADPFPSRYARPPVMRRAD